MILFAFGLTVIQIPGITAGAIHPGWAYLSVLLPFLVSKVEMNLLHWLGAIFIIYAGLSLLWAPTGTEAFWHLCLIVGCFCLGSIVNLRSIYIGLALGVTISSIIVLFQVNGIDVVPENAAPAGLFANKLVLGWLACLVLIGLVSKKLWWYIPGVLPSALLTEARSAILGVTVAGFVWLWPRSRMSALGIAFAIVIAAVVIILINYRMEGIQVREYIWIDTLKGFTLFGHGIGSFDYYFPMLNTYLDPTITRPDHAHNDFIEYIFELGIGVIPLFVIIALLLWQKENEVFIGYLVMAFFGFPTYHPATAFIGAIVAGKLASDWSLVRYKSYFSRSNLYAQC